jgi:hypothetical protein
MTTDTENDLFYVVLQTKDSLQLGGFPPTAIEDTNQVYAIVVEASSDEDAHAPIQAKFSPLAREKEFGDVLKADKGNGYWIMRFPKASHQSERFEFA